MKITIHLKQINHKTFKKCSFPFQNKAR